MFKGSYLEYKLGMAADPAAMLETLKNETLNAIDYGTEEDAISTGLTFLLSLSTYANPKQISLSGTFDEVMRRLCMVLYHMHTKIAMSEFAWPACCGLCTAQCPDDPEEPDDWSEFEQICSQEDSDKENNTPSIEKTEGEEQEVCWSYPNMSRWDEWTVADWIRFEGWKRKVLSAAMCDLGTMSIVINALQDVKENISRLGITRQVQVAMWASNLVDGLCTTLEQALSDICRSNIATRQGRMALKEMLSPDPDPDDAYQE